MKIALAQINTTVGAVRANKTRIMELIGHGRDRGADLVVFPELAITGYPPLDLLEHRSFIAANLEALDEIARFTSADGMPGAIVGFVDRCDAGLGTGLSNSAALIDGGRIISRHAKSLLPTYDVFDEARYFDPAPQQSVRVAEFRGTKLAITICEDFWNDRLHWKDRLYDFDPVERLAAQGPELMITISASPYWIGKRAVRDAMYRAATRRHGVPLVYVNLVGGNDSLIFGGASNVWGAGGEQIAQAASFTEDFLLVDLDLEAAKAGGDAEADSKADADFGLSAEALDKPFDLDSADQTELIMTLQDHYGIEIPECADEQFKTVGDLVRFARRRGGADTTVQTLAPVEASAEEAQQAEAQSDPTPDEGGDSAEAYDALCLGVRDYVRKCGFDRVVIGLSGGIDSALTAAIAVDALGAEAVTGLAMPSEFSSEHSVTDAEALAANLGIELLSLPIASIYESSLEVLRPVFADRPFGVAEENLQARTRGNLIMAVSNKFGWLVLTTGNKSEMAVGYCTLYGDMNGGLAVLSDVLKTRVFDMARWVNRDGERIPINTIDKPPSAELRPDQKDTDSLPPYEELDPIIEAYVERHMHASEIASSTGADRELVARIVRMIDRNEYKRRQAATGLKITDKAFGIGRRMPIARGDWA